MKIELGPITIKLCRYEKCKYYLNQKHPKTGHTCAFGQPSCRLGKLDMAISYPLVGFSTSLLHKLKKLQCRLLGHNPYLVPAPPKVNPHIIACKRCGKRLK